MTSASAALTVAMVALLGRASAAVPQETHGTRPPVLSPDSRVRALDRTATRLLATAVSCSPTVTQAIAALEASDVMVGIETWPLRKTTSGELRIVTAARGARYLRVRLRVPSSPADLISVLAHELQHAREVADAPEVRDLATQRTYYERIGWLNREGGYFETQAALEAGRRVAREMLAARSRPACR